MIYLEISLILSQYLSDEQSGYNVKSGELVFNVNFVLAFGRFISEMF